MPDKSRSALLEMTPVADVELRGSEYLQRSRPFRETVNEALESTLALIYPAALSEVSSVIQEAVEAGLVVLAVKTLHISMGQAREFHFERSDEPDFEELCSRLSSGPLHAACFQGPDAIQRWQLLIGTNSPSCGEGGGGSFDAFYSRCSHSTCHATASRSSIEAARPTRAGVLFRLQGRSLRLDLGCHAVY